MGRAKEMGGFVCTGSHEAMVECQGCGLFSHASCMSTVSSVKMCRACLTKGTGLNLAQRKDNLMASDLEYEMEAGSRESHEYDVDGDEDEDENDGMDDEDRCNNSSSNSKLNEVLSS